MNGMWNVNNIYFLIFRVLTTSIIALFFTVTVFNCSLRFVVSRGQPEIIYLIEQITLTHTNWLNVPNEGSCFWPILQDLVLFERRFYWFNGLGFASVRSCSAVLGAGHCWSGQKQMLVENKYCQILVIYFGYLSITLNWLNPRCFF